MIDGVRAAHRPLAARSRRRRNTAAWSVSLGLHLLIGVALHTSASGQLLAMESADSAQGAISITLVAASALQPAAPPEATDSLRPLLAKYSSEQPPVELAADPHSKGMAQLMQRFQGAAAFAVPPTARAPLSRITPDTGQGDARQTPVGISKAQHGGAENAAPTGTAGDLWGAIAPCWNKHARTGTVHVTLEVTLDVHGKLSAPPKIIREGGEPLDEARLRSEASALAALSECLVDGDLRFGGRTYRAEFPSS